MSRDEPSKTTDGHWLHAAREHGEYPDPTPRSGKWLIFVKREEADARWREIRAAVEAGELGHSAKVATAKPNPHAKDPSKHVICVYTYDSEDREDVRRVRQALRDLGITHRIPYKTDQATRAGRYETRGHRRISRYYE
jgi:hypothetical protein